MKPVYKKLLLTVPALLAGPVIIMAISLTIYDFSVAGGLFTMAMVSGGALKEVWGTSSLTLNSTTDERVSGVHGRNARMTKTEIAWIVAALLVMGLSVAFQPSGYKVVGQLVAGIICAYVASRKNRSPISWGCAGFVFAIFTLIVLAFQKKVSPVHSAVAT